MDAQAIFDRLSAVVGDAVFEFTTTGTKDAHCKTRPERWHDVATALASTPELQMDFLQCVTAVDWPKKNVIEMVYHLYSYPHHHSFVVKADLPRERPVIASCSDVWPTAEWHEREEFDLFGVGFENHPDLRRVMMPDDWPGHPMRKDYKEAEAYRGMPTSRPSPLNLLVVYDKAPPEKRLPVLQGDAGASGEAASDE